VVPTLREEGAILKVEAKKIYEVLAAFTNRMLRQVIEKKGLKQAILFKGTCRKKGTLINQRGEKGKIGRNCK